VLRAGQAQCLTILNLLNQPDASPVDVAQVVETDPVLTLRVLHLVNSGVYALGHQVDTVRQAVVLLGPAEVSTLVTALALEAQPGAMDRLWFILARAMACEVLADDGAAYTVGMLSALASQLGVPVNAVLAKVGVSQVLGDAIAREAGPLGQVLRAVRAHERSDPDGVVAAGMDPVIVSRVYLGCLRDALSIARTVTREG
jgi:EAL and modified HD-GYP domain-containing signal transduction protein